MMPHLKKSLSNKEYFKQPLVWLVLLGFTTANAVDSTPTPATNAIVSITTPTIIQTAVTTSLPTSTPTIKPTLLPTQIPTIKPTISPTPSPAPTATPLPEIKQTGFSEFVAPLKLEKEMEIETGKLRVKKDFLEDSGSDEQTILMPYFSRSQQDNLIFFQHRINPFTNFSLVIKDLDKGATFVPTKQAYIADSATYCPQTKEIVFLAPGVDEHNKILKDGRGRRVFLHSLMTNETKLIWRKTKERIGLIAPQISTTPDCEHILLNLQLEKSKNGIPYGELIYLRKIKGKAKHSEPEWIENVVHETTKNGVFKNYGSVAFIQPKDSAYYLKSSIPPNIFAIEDQVDKDATAPRVFIFAPNNKGSNWKRNQISIGEGIRNIWNPTFYNRTDFLWVLLEKKEVTSTGATKKEIALINLDITQASLQELVIPTDRFDFRSIDVNPMGNKILASFTGFTLPNEKENSPVTQRAGIMEIENKEKKLSYFIFENLSPFHAFGNKYDPRPRYDLRGKTMFYAKPDITAEALEEEDLLGTSAKAKEVDFPIRIIRANLE